MKSAKRILAITILLSALYLPIQASSKSSPRIVFFVDSYDLGKVPVGTIVSAEFPFFNDGNSPLVISRIKVEALEGCCPPRAVVGSTTLLPGQSSSVMLRFTMHEGMGGKHVLLIRVRSNDPLEPEKKLLLKVDFEEGKK